ncbi:CHRD domain-containing protein [Streptomyces sp. H27-C3]|uniref:CHRD domain-containing protein n=1 Tax=Streptomyces sp. H27-C3 TaxID=3046305 RepID=UPI0024B8D0E1|nr:CHRD domain-containing protein [Streptomyces sp. H27-C3]MDJ0464233.1 CHRD domain-containing protein [Streptomyces sp. H27-C3]
MRVLTTMMASAVGCAAALTALTAPATAASGPPSADGADKVAQGKADLTGREEVPGPGDRNGAGEFWFQVKHGSLCYSLRVRKIEQPTAAHIHAGKRGTAGPVAITLKTPKHGKSNGCIKAQHTQTTKNAATVLTHRELREIACTPHKFYANVHNRPFPDGAVRGQLNHH